MSAGLGQIARSFATTQAAATALQSRLGLIHSTFNRGIIMAGSGAALALPLIAATHAAEKYQHQLNQMHSAGLSNKELAESVAAAWKTTGNVITSTATENLKVIMDLRSVFGHTAEGIDYMPKFAKIQGAYASVLDGKLSKHSDELTFAMAKALDMIGAVKNREVFDKSANAMFRVTEATGGRVTPADYMTTFKYARQAKFGMNDEFLYKILPELIIENKGGGGGTSGGVGPQLAALYRFGVQGIMNKRSAQRLQEMGMIPSSSILKTTTSGTTLKGGVLGSGTLAHNPFEWVTKVFIPRLAQYNKINPNNLDAMVQASNQVFKGNQLAATLVAELIKKQQQYTRFGPLYEKTDTLDKAYDRGMKNDPSMNWKALAAAFENLKISIGEHIVPVLIPAINKMASSIQQAASFLHNHPGWAKAIAAIIAVASSALILGGALNIAKAAFMGLQLMISPATSAVVRIATAIGTGGLLTAARVALGAVGPLGITILAVSLVVANWDRVMKVVHANSGFFIHIAAQTARMIDHLGLTFRKLGSAIMWLFETIGAYMSSIPMMAEFGQHMQIAALQAQNKIQRALKPDEMTLKRDVKDLQRRGAGWYVDAVKGPKQTVVNQTNNITVKQVPGHDHDKCWKDGVSKLIHASSAGSGNSVGRSINHGGATRP